MKLWFVSIFCLALSFQIGADSVDHHHQETVTSTEKLGVMVFSARFQNARLNSYVSVCVVPGLKQIQLPIKNYRKTCVRHFRTATVYNSSHPVWNKSRRFRGIALTQQQTQVIFELFQLTSQFKRGFVAGFSTSIQEVVHRGLNGSPFGFDLKGEKVKGQVKVRITWEEGN